MFLGNYVPGEVHTSGHLKKRLVEIMITLIHYRIRRIILQNKGIYYGYQDMYLVS